MLINDDEPFFVQAQEYLNGYRDEYAWYVHIRSSLYDS